MVLSPPRFAGVDEFTTAQLGLSVFGSRNQAKDH